MAADPNNAVVADAIDRTRRSWRISMLNLSATWQLPSGGESNENKRQVQQRMHGMTCWKMTPHDRDGHMLRPASARFLIHEYLLSSYVR